MKKNTFVLALLCLGAVTSTSRVFAAETTSLETVSPTSVSHMSDVHKRQAGIPTARDLELITKKLLPYDYYERTLDYLQKAHGYTPAEKLNAIELSTLGREFCAYMDTVPGQLTDADVVHFTALSRVEKIRRSGADAQTGSAMALGVYYRCAEHTDTLHDWAYKISPDPETNHSR